MSETNEAVHKCSPCKIQHTRGLFLEPHCADHTCFGVERDDKQAVSGDCHHSRKEFDEFFGTCGHWSDDKGLCRHKCEFPAAAVLKGEAPKHLKLWVCQHCLSPRLYGSSNECRVCGSDKRDVGDYFLQQDEQTVEAASVIELRARDLVWSPDSWDAYLIAKENGDSPAEDPEFWLLAQAVEAKFGPQPLGDEDLAYADKVIADVGMSASDAEVDAILRAADIEPATLANEFINRLGKELRAARARVDELEGERGKKNHHDFDCNKLVDELKACSCGYESITVEAALGELRTLTPHRCEIAFLTDSERIRITVWANSIIPMKLFTAYGISIWPAMAAVRKWKEASNG